MSNTTPSFRGTRTNDPQITVEGQLKEGDHTDLIVFPIELGLLEMVCIVNIPSEGETVAPVYIKHKIHGAAPRFSDRNSGKPHRTNDPQITVEGQLKEGEYTDLIVFTIELGMFELVCIVNIPSEGTTAAPVYVKHKVRGAAPRYREVRQTEVEWGNRQDSKSEDERFPDYGDDSQAQASDKD